MILDLKNPLIQKEWINPKNRLAKKVSTDSYICVRDLIICKNIQNSTLQRLLSYITKACLPIYP